MEFKIGKRQIANNAPLYFIADIAANHDGDLKRAFRLIELAKSAGADAAKFQNFKAEKIVSKKGFESLGSRISHQSSWKKPVYEIYQDASISGEWTQSLKNKCDQVGIEYCSSPYDFESVDLINRYVNFFKIGSGDITWPEIIDYIASKKKPVMLATGASDMVDVNRAIKIIKRHTDKIVLMQCNTNYTGSPENFKYINLNVLKQYKKHFPQIVLGLSDHTLGYATILGGVALGARVFEKHFTDDNNRIGPDHRFSMNPATWKEMVKNANDLYQALGDGIKKVEKNEKETVMLQRRAFRYACNFPKGHKLKASDIFPLRPMHKAAVPPYEIKKILGKRLKYDVKIDDCVYKEDLNV